MAKNGLITLFHCPFLLFFGKVFKICGKCYYLEYVEDDYIFIYNLELLLVWMNPLQQPKLTHLLNDWSRNSKNWGTDLSKMLYADSHCVLGHSLWNGQDKFIRVHHSNRHKHKFNRIINLWNNFPQGNLSLVVTP